MIEVERRDDGVAVLRLQRPDKRNALNRELRQTLIDQLAALEIDEAVLAVVVTGAGGSFCAGFDLDELMAADDQQDVFAHSTAYHRAVHTFSKPIVAAVEGVAVAGGMDLALLCDLRVAATDARFGQPQVKLGVPAAYELVRSVIRESAARDLCLTGRLVSATEAAEFGMVDRLVEPGSALAEAVELAAEIGRSAGAVMMKRVFVSEQSELFGTGGAENS